MFGPADFSTRSQAALCLGGLLLFVFWNDIEFYWKGEGRYFSGCYDPSSLVHHQLEFLHMNGQWQVTDHEPPPPPAPSFTADQRARLMAGTLSQEETEPIEGRTSPAPVTPEVHRYTMRVRKGAELTTDEVEAGVFAVLEATPQADLKQRPPPLMKVNWYSSFRFKDLDWVALQTIAVEGTRVVPVSYKKISPGLCPPPLIHTEYVKESPP